MWVRESFDMLSASERYLLSSLVRINTVIMAVVGGAFLGSILWLATAILLLRMGGNVGDQVSLLSVFLPAYEISWKGAWIGFIWGFVIGATSGAFLYWSYSRTLGKHLHQMLLDRGPSAGLNLPVFLMSGPALGTAVGCLGALQLFLSTNWLVISGPSPHADKAALLSNYLPGYSISLSGSVIGSAELFALLFLAGLLFAGLYNFVVKLRAARYPWHVSGSRAHGHFPPSHVVILGAGPAGLATAHELSANGVKVTVLEKNAYVGGLCRTVEDQGYRFDLGGHRWFTKNEDLNNWFRRLMAGHLVLVKRISRIYSGGQYFLYPVSLGDVVKKAGAVTIAKAGLSFAWALLRYGGLGAPIKNMKDAYTAQFGSTLYELFFRRYSEKVWGKPCELLSADWVSQRSKGLSIWTVAREALLSRKSKVTSLIEEFMYPRDGYMKIPERMAEDVARAGNDIKLGATVKRIVRHGPAELQVIYKGQDGDQSIFASHVVSTIPLGLLVQILTPAPPENVLKAARSLEFRDLITVNLKIRKKQVSIDTWLYVQDEAVIFGRLHEPKNWSKAMVPDDEHTSLVLECFCSAGDAVWSMSDDEIANRCIKDLAEKLHFLEQCEVEGWNLVRTRHAYPVYDLEYADKLGVIRSFLADCPGVHIVGRGGTFRYNNADHSIEMGLLLGRRLLGYTVDHMEVNTEQEYHEEKGSEPIARDHYKVDGLTTVGD
jgi:protoporphyrinogen oxidase